MLRQEIEWELKEPVKWSNHPDGYFYVERPASESDGYWQEKNLKKELEALNHFAHTKAMDGVKGMIGKLLESNWVIVETSEELKTVIDFSSIKELYETWEFVRQCCQHYGRFHVYEDESYVGCKHHDEGQRVLFGRRGEWGHSPILRCPYAKYLAPGTKEIEDQHKCKDFKSERKLRPFMEIVEEVDRP